MSENAQTELEEVNLLLDKLCLNILKLMEDEIRVKISIERAMQDGDGSLVKSRYIMGFNSISSIQIPSVEGPGQEATTTLTRNQSEEFFNDFWQLEENKSKSNDPIKWFGLLVPRDLHSAQDSYRNALKFCVEVANIQYKLIDLLSKYRSLKAHKKTLKGL